MSDGVKVSPEEVLRDGGAVRSGTFLQTAGIRMARWFGVAGAVVLLLLLAEWLKNSPQPPVLAVGVDPEQAKAAIEHYRQMQDVALEPVMKILDSVVVKLFLPIFTSILGYIFGSREASNRER